MSMKANKASKIGLIIMVTELIIMIIFALP